LDDNRRIMVRQERENRMIQIGEKVSVLLPFWMQTSTIGPYVQGVVTYVGDQRILIKYIGDNEEISDWVDSDRVAVIERV